VTRDRSESAQLNTATTFGALLRAHRCAAGLTQAALGERAGLSARGIQNLELGLHQPYRATVERLARALGLDTAERAAFEAAATPTPRRRASRRSKPDQAPGAPAANGAASPEAAATPETVDGAARLAAPLPAPAELALRPRTALHTALVDYPALAARLPAVALDGLVAAWRAQVAAEVEHYGGTAYPVGPAGCVALFGVPRAQEDHAVRALHAALGVRAVTAAHAETAARRWRVPLQARVGVASAPPAADANGDAASTGADAAPRDAERLHDQAAPGAILVSARTRRAAGAAFAWRALPAAAGAEPGYELLGQAEGASRFAARASRGLTPFVGRAAELRSLDAAWQAARAGQGQLVAVRGEAGIGKSRLLYELQQRLTTEGAVCYTGASFAHAESVSYLPFLAILRACLGLDAAAPLATARAALNQRLAALGRDPAAVAPYLLHLLGYPTADEALARLEPAVLRERTVAALVTLFTAEASRAPWVLMLEDAHWLDAASAAVLAALADALPAAPLLVVVTYRPEDVPARAAPGGSPAGGAAVLWALRDRPFAREIALAGLPPAGAAALARATLPTADVASEVVRFIAAKSEGHPLFAEELAHALVDGGALARRGGRYALATPTAAALPTTVADLLLARLDRLPAALQPVLRAAATIGQVFEYDVLQATLPTAVSLDRLLLQLEDFDVVYPTRLTPRREYAFKHALVQEAAYSLIAPTERAALHARVGAAVETLRAERLTDEYERLAYHYGRSERAEKALQYLLLAHGKALRASAAAEAQAYFEQARGLLDNLPQTPTTLRQRISLLSDHYVVAMELLQHFGDYYAQLVRYADHAEAVDDPALAGAYLHALAHCHWAFGRLRDGIAVGQRAAALCQMAGQFERAGLALFAAQICHLALGEYDQTREHTALIEQALRREGDLRHYVRAVAVHAYADAFQGRWATAIPTAQRALALAEEFAGETPRAPGGDLGHLLFWAHNALALIYGLQGALGPASEHAALAVAHAHALGDQVWAHATQGWIWCRAGDVARGLERLAPSVAIYKSESFAAGTAMHQTFLGESYLRAGQLDAAHAALADVVARTERWGMPLEQGMAHRLLGELALETAPAAAAAHLERAVALLASIGAENELALALAAYGRLHEQDGDALRARLLPPGAGALRPARDARHARAGAPDSVARLA
jgi:transcriptional regulator with XRE-family HTH domain/tetratricopeptide (TPR) repeat protein